MLEDRRDGGGGVSEATTVRRYDFPGCGLISFVMAKIFMAVL